MNRQDKQACIAHIAQSFTTSSGAFLVGVQGLTVEQMQALRVALRKQNGKIQVVKNTLSRRALQQIGGMSELESYCKRQVALVFAEGDASAVARVIADYAKEHVRLQVIAGRVEQRTIDKEMVQWFATLPGREQLLAQVCGALSGPMVAQVSVLSQMMSRLACVIQQVHAQKSESAS